MIIKNKYFRLCICTVIFQQITLAVSTYFIAMAGESLVSANMISLKRFIVLFFAAALLAYLLGSCIEWFQIKFRNDLWKRYIEDVFSKINKDPCLSSSKNQQWTLGWLGTEAPSSFTEASQFIVSTISVYCNVVFTLIVFGFALGSKVTLAMTISLLVSFLLIKLLKNRISQLADGIQTSKLNMVLGLRVLWNNNLFSNNALNISSNTKFQETSGKYFKQTEKYGLIEQVVACSPTYIAIPLVVISMLTMIDAGTTAIGAFVAVLPRTLQLFGNVHSLSLSNSRLLLVMKKVKNLKDFVNKLEIQNFNEQINIDEIKITNLISKDRLSASDFMEKITQKTWVNGRFLITGKNGAGKSSLLKLIKKHNPESILIKKNAEFFQIDASISSGEQQILQMEHGLLQTTDLFLLDEWDSNLDDVNIKLTDAKINNLAKESLVIEVRHRTSN